MEKGFLRICVREEIEGEKIKAEKEEKLLNELSIPQGKVIES